MSYATPQYSQKERPLLRATWWLGLSLLVALFIIGVVGCGASTPQKPMTPQEWRTLTILALRNAAAAVRDLDTSERALDRSRALLVVSEWVENEGKVDRQKLCGSVGVLYGLPEELEALGHEPDPRIAWLLSAGVALCQR